MGQYAVNTLLRPLHLSYPWSLLPSFCRQWTSIYASAMTWFCFEDPYTCCPFCLEYSVEYLGTAVPLSFLLQVYVVMEECPNSCYLVGQLKPWRLSCSLIISLLYYWFPSL